MLQLAVSRVNNILLTFFSFRFSVLEFQSADPNKKVKQEVWKYLSFVCFYFAHDPGWIHEHRDCVLLFTTVCSNKLRCLTWLLLLLRGCRQLKAADAECGRGLKLCHQCFQKQKKKKGIYYGIYMNPSRSWFKRKFNLSAALLCGSNENTSTVWMLVSERPIFVLIVLVNALLWCPKGLN